MRHHHEIKISEFNQDTVPNILAGLKENDQYLMLSKEFEKEHSVVLDGAKELSELLETYK